MSTYATVDDIAALYEGASLPDRAQALLDRAERELARRVPSLATRVASASDAVGHIDQGFVRDVLVDAVIRSLRNPRGLASETDGDYSYQLASGAAVPNGSVQFTEDELAFLRGPLAGTAWANVGSIGLKPGMSPGRFPRWLRGDPSAWTGEEPAGVIPSSSQEVPVEDVTTGLT